MGARITPSMLVRSHSVSDPRWSPSGTALAWIDAFDGRADLLVAPADGGGPPLVVSADSGAGGGYCWVSDDQLVVGGRDGLVLVGAAGGVIRRLTQDGRAFSPVVSVRGEVACSIERTDACDVVTVPLDGSQWPQRVSDASYAWDPCWSPDGAQLAWHEWTLPDMPWDASRIVVRDDDGTTTTVADAPGCGQPRFSPDGTHLAYIRETQLWIDDERLIAEKHEHAEPSSGPGQRSYAWSPDGAEIAWCRNEDGFGRLVIGAPGRKSARELSKGWHRGLDWGAGGIVCARSGGVTPGQIVVLAPNGSARHTIARGPVGGFEATGLAEAKPVKWKSGNATVHGLLWRAAEPKGLMVLCHGGPTGQAIVDWNPRIQYFLQRGWSALQVNYRGSTGYGAQYRTALEGKWGVLDSDDTVAGIRYAVKEDWAGARNIVLMGGSAGGLTVLNAAAALGDAIAGVIALFPVADLLELDATTHRFESGYTARLVGPLPDARAAYVAHSATTNASKISAPTLLLHGADDDNVPPSQSATIEAILQRAGTPVERHVYEGEGHGWRKASTVADELDRINAFLTRYVGI
jgi:dipeptidyl aminopeptidase/acylaminoacyl peptidase